jgi:hypothetical protein
VYVVHFIHDSSVYGSNIYGSINLRNSTIEKEYILMAKSKTPKTNGGNEVVSNPGVTVANAATTEVAGTTAETTVVKKARAAKSPEAKSAAPKLEAVPRSNNLVPINLEDEIRKAAYLISERRGFVAGYESEDWMAAEREVRQRYRQQHSA